MKTIGTRHVCIHTVRMRSPSKLLICLYLPLFAYTLPPGLPTYATYATYLPATYRVALHAAGKLDEHNCNDQAMVSEPGITDTAGLTCTLCCLVACWLLLPFTKRACGGR